MPSKSIVLLAISLMPLAAAAQDVAPGGVAELGGPRTTGLSAGIGIASGNDGIYVNPAALAARRRYSAETQLWTERRGADTTAQVWTASVADSLSSSVAAAVAYGRVLEGTLDTGSTWHLAMAGSIAQGIFVGATGKYYELSPEVTGREAVSAVTVDAGLFWEVTKYIGLGLTGYNLAPTSHEVVLPRAVGAGLSIGSDTGIQATFDWRGELEGRDGSAGTTNRYSVGLEALLGNVAPLRAGYVFDETLDTQWWSVGVGLVSASGGGVDVAYRQSVDDESARVISASVKLQFAQ